MRQIVVAFTLGARPTPGYSIELLGTQFQRQGENLVLQFRERVPNAGQFMQQVTTQPCVLILTERGKWQHVILRDADTGTEVRADLTPAQSAGPVDKQPENPQVR